MASIGDLRTSLIFDRVERQRKTYVCKTTLIIMGKTVECCISNMNSDERKLLKESSIKVRERTCLEHCGLCSTGQLLIVNGKPVMGDNYQRMSERLEE